MKSFLWLSIVFFASFSAQNIFAQEEWGASSAKPAQVISESQFQSYMTVCRAVKSEILKDRKAPWETNSAAMVKALKDNGMTPKEFAAIDYAIYCARWAIFDQSSKLFLDTKKDEDFVEMAKLMGSSPQDIQDMKKARNQKRKWYKGTPEAPAINLELVERNEKELGEIFAIESIGINGKVQGEETIDYTFYLPKENPAE